MAKPAKPIFSWRDAVLSSKLPATTKHVLLTLACYFNDVGSGAFPSVRTLMDDTSLSNRAVLTHLQNARDLGWIESWQHGKGKEWKHNNYKICYPKGVVLGGELGSPPIETKVVNVVPLGGERGDVQVVKDVHSSTSIEYSEEYSESVSAFSEEPKPQNQTEAPCRNCGEIGRHTCPGGSPKFRRKGRRDRPARFSPSTEAPKPEVIELPARPDALLRGFYRGLRLLFKERTGKSLGDLGRESGEVLAEACARHGPEAIEKGFVAWLDAKADYARTRDRPGMLFIYSIEDWVAEAQVVYEKPVSRVPELTR